MLGIAAFYVIFCIILSYYYFVWSNKKYKNFPPGPRPWPLIGNLLETGNAHHLTMTKLSKQYGPIVGMQMGQDKVIYIHGAKLIREAFSMPEFGGKFKRECAVFLVGDGDGIIQSEGEVWAEQRRFAIRALREFGFGKSGMEGLIQENVNDLIDWFKKQAQRPISVHHRFRLAMVNALWQIVTGQKFNQDDSQLFDILHELDRTMMAMFSFQSIKGVLIFYYPKIAQLFPKWSGWAKLQEESAPREEMFQRIINDHVHTQVKDEPRDFVDSYLEEINQTTNQSSSFHPKVGYNSLKSVMSEMFMAGNDTTATATTWAILYLMHHPQVQVKLQQELDGVVGRNRRPCLADKKLIPYAEAVINESLRFASVSPMNLVHECVVDVKFHGYDIPKGTHIFGNLHDCQHDPAIWGDPEIFRPERFLTPDGTQLVKYDSFLPFSTGKRVCIGKNFATDSLFLFVTNLVHTFHICPPGLTERSSLNKIYGTLALRPESSTVIMQER